MMVGPSLNNRVPPLVTLANKTNSASLANEPLFTLGLILTCGLSFTGTVTNAVLIYFLRRTSIIDANVKFLLNHLGICGLVGLVYLMLKSAVSLGFIYSKNDLPPPLPNYLCYLQERPFACSQTGIIASLLLLGVERLVVTRRCLRNNLQQDERISRWVVATLFLCWSIVFGVFVVNFTLNLDPTKLPHCDNVLNLSKEPNIRIGSSLIFLVGELCSIGAFVWVFYLSQSRLKAFAINQAYLTLRARIMLRRSIGLSTFLIPAAILHAIIHVPQFCWNILYEQLHVHPSKEFVISLYLLYLPHVVYVNAYALLCLFGGDPLRGHVLAMCTVERRRRSAPSFSMSDNPVSSEEESCIRMQNLEHMWNKAYYSTQKKESRSQDGKNQQLTG